MHYAEPTMTRPALRLWQFGLAAACAVAIARPAPAQEPVRRLAVKAAKVLPVSGPPIHDGVVLMENGVITAVGPAKHTPIPAGTRVLDAGDGWVCPGFIDLHNHIGGLMSDINDMVHPTNPELSTWPTIDPENWLLQRAARWGVTTVLYIPGSGTNLSGFGVLMKTHGRTPEEYLVRFPGAMKVAQGYNPERWGGDLGFSRMGMWWSLEQTLDRGKVYADAWKAHAAGGAPKPTVDPELEMLRGLFERKYPVIVHTAGARDIMGTVTMFKEKYGLQVIASHATFDAYRAAQAVADSGVPVNLGPRNYDMFFSRTGRMQPLASDYVAAGVKRFSLNTDAPVIPGEELFFQGTICVRLGIDRATAIRALTLEPALAVGIADQCGSLEPGKDADLYVTSGDPLDPRSRPLWTIVRGKLALDHTNPAHAALPMPRSTPQIFESETLQSRPGADAHDGQDGQDGHDGHGEADCPFCGGFERERELYAGRYGARK